uniref:Trophoblast glycoprotein-like n=1 Tax=Takifugu rubripes TaxID=31033 RepID=H2U9Y0_TAKRU
MSVFVFRVFLGILLCSPCRCLECPFGCECFAVTRTVKCISSNLQAVPQSVPGYTRTLIITGNHISQIGPDSFAELTNVTSIILSNNRITALDSYSFSTLLNLHFLDLSGNRLMLIHPEALSLLRLDLSGNQLTLLPPGMFSHLPSLQQLFLANNSLVALYGGTFSGMSHLQMLDLMHNAFTTFRTDALQELDRLGNIQILLGENPYTCSCDIRNFVAWLNESRAQVDVDALRCASPRELSNTQLWGISILVADLTLQTSYVFLGLVLGLVGMVFLFVLYLNRHGMKNWIIEMRDACRDVLEGYNYRFEIDSDPHLGHISSQNGRTRRNPEIPLSQQLPSDTCITRVPSNPNAEQLTTSPHREPVRL